MNMYIKNIALQNYGPIDSFSCDNFSNINLIVGDNGVGKTFLLKALYSALRTLEDYRGEDNVCSVNDILSEKLYWTFQAGKLGDLVAKSSQGKLSFSVNTSHSELSYCFSGSTASKISSVSNRVHNNVGHAIFIPAGEVLSLHSVIRKSRDIDCVFGFDDTYYDLVKKLSAPIPCGTEFLLSNKARNTIHSSVDGRIDFDSNTSRWYYRNNKNQKFSINVMSESAKKFAVIKRLLSNGQLNKNSVLFIDNVEMGLHPQAICDFLDMLFVISQEMDIQIFISSHSYFVLKKLYLIGLRHPHTINGISLSNNNPPVVMDWGCDWASETSIMQTFRSLCELPTT